jgi:uncharacterized protein YaaN involved in tellurite resistance
MTDLDPVTEFTPEDEADRAAVEALAARLDDLSPGAILAFGRDAEEEMAHFADIVLDQAFGREEGALGAHLDEIRSAAASAAAMHEPDRGGLLRRLFAGRKREIERLTDRFFEARRRIDTVALRLDDQIHATEHGLVVLDRLFRANAAKVRELTRCTSAGWLALAHHRARAVAATESGTAGADGLAAQRFRDLQDGIDRLERRVADLEQSRVVTLGMLATIRQTQAVGLALVEELRKTIDHAIPAWKASMVVRLQQLRQRHGLDSLEALDAPATTPAAEEADALIAALDKVAQLEKDAAAARERSRSTLAEAELALRDGKNGDNASR